MNDLSIVIPCFNEAKRLPTTLRAIHAFCVQSSLTIEVLVVDDGSTDDTVHVAQSMAAYMPQLRIQPLGKNYGKGRAVQYGMLSANGTYVLFMDADNATAINEVEKLLPFTATYAVVIGSRYVEGSDVVLRQSRYRRFVSRVGNGLIRLLLVKGIQDTQCGFKLFSSTAARDIFSRVRTMGFGFDIEVLAIAQRLGHAVKEVGVVWHSNSESRFRPVYDVWRTLKELARITYHQFIWRNRAPIIVR